MGYYYEKARTSKDLDEKQLSRYGALRSEDQELHPELRRRLREIQEHIGPVVNGETWSAYEELAQDTFVTWILSGEDSDTITWSEPSDLVVESPPRTEEEKRASAEAWRTMTEEWDRRWAEREAEESENRKRHKRELRDRYLKNPLLIFSDWIFRIKQDLLR